MMKEHIFLRLLDEQLLWLKNRVKCTKYRRLHYCTISSLEDLHEKLKQYIIALIKQKLQIRESVRALMPLA